MPVLNAGRYQHWVALDDPVPDGTPVTFSPSRVKCAIRSAGISSEDKVVWTVQLRYHAQITMNTRITLDDGRQLFVREIENIGNMDRSNVLTLTCEEVVTP